MQPHRLKIGSGLILVSIDGLSADWGIPEEAVTQVVALFEIPLIKFPGGDKRYVNLWSLELALFEAGLPSACKGTQKEVRAIHAAAGIVYGTLSKEVIRERLNMLRGELREAGPQTSKYRKKAGTGKRSRSRKPPKPR